jgi:hypothetical protein
MFQLIIFGYAVNLDVDNLRMGWMDMDQSPQSHDLLADFQGSGRFLLTALPQSEKDIQNVLDRGEAQVIVRVLPGFGRSILLGRPTSAQILVDGTNSNTASLASAYTSQLVGAYSASLATAQMQSRMMARAGMGTMSMKVGRMTDSARVWFNPDLKQPQLLRARRHLQSDHGSHRDAHRHGHRPRKGNRHHGTVDGDAHPAHGTDDRQDGARRHGRPDGPGADDYGCAC